MARFISLKDRVFILDIDKWREMRKRGRYLRYCIKPVRDERNSLARNIDFYGPLAAVLLVTGAVAAGYGGVRPGSLAAALPLMALEIFIAFRLRKWFRANARLHYRLWTAGRQCQENIKKMGSARRLEKLMVEILEKIDGFSELKPAGGKGRKEKPEGGIAVRALLQGEPVAVACLLPDSDNSLVSPECVLKFREEMINNGFRKGIIAAAGFFSGEARRAALEDRKNSRIVLLDLYRLVDLARETGHRVFPALPGDQPGEAAKNTGAYRGLFRKALSRDKANGYLYAAGTILAMYCTAGDAGGMIPFYAVFGAVNLGLSLYCILSNRESELLRPAQEK